MVVNIVQIKYDSSNGECEEWLVHEKLYHEQAEVILKAEIAPMYMYPEIAIDIAECMEEIYNKKGKKEKLKMRER